MMNLNYELIGILITVIIQGLYVAYKMGKFEEKLNALEKKQDKHNNVIERTVAVEASTKSAHKRLDEAEEDFKELKEGIHEIRNFLIAGAGVGSSNSYPHERGGRK